MPSAGRARRASARPGRAGERQGSTATRPAWRPLRRRVVVKRHQEMQRQQQEAAETMRRAEALKLAAESQAAAVE